MKMIPEKRELLSLLAEKERRIVNNKLSFYCPYAMQRVFHRAGADESTRERLLMAGNQLGKSLCGSMEYAMHLTGQYPDWWDGVRFDHNIVGWAASETSQGTRDTVQRLLLGDVGAWGTGAIPANCIVDIKRAAHGVSDAVETILVKHVNGKTSRVTLKTYDQGRARWQGETLDLVWFDEEPPEDVYIEGLTRTNATNGVVYVTFTPLKGMSKVVKRFLVDKQLGTAVTKMTIEDAEHYTPEQRLKIVAAYPSHEREARALGEPTLGSGAIFPIDESEIKEPAVSIPRHWPRICGIDFGWDHPTACAWIAYDRDTDTAHVYDAYRRSEATPVIHAATINAKGKWIPVAWPHDGLQHDKGSGEALAQQYKNLGVNMLKMRATHPPERGQAEGSGGNSLEAGLMDMLDRMQTGRLKVAAHLHEWFSELRQYHRDKGRVVAIDDDLLSATRYALMMLRKAVTQTTTNNVPAIGRYQIHDSATGVMG